MIDYVLTIGGSLLSGKSTLNSLVTLSTTNVEYMVLTLAAKEYIWLIGLVGELGIHQKVATMCYDS